MWVLVWILTALLLYLSEPQSQEAIAFLCSSTLLVYLGRQQKIIQCLHPCYPHGRLGWSSRLSALVSPVLAIVAKWAINRLLGDLSVAPHNSSYNSLWFCPVNKILKRSHLVPPDVLVKMTLLPIYPYCWLLFPWGEWRFLTFAYNFLEICFSYFKGKVTKRGRERHRGLPLTG